MATSTRQSRAVANAKSRLKGKAGRQAAIAAAVKPQPKAKPEPVKAKAKFVCPTKEEQEASDDRFYSTLEAHGVTIDNPKTGKRLSRGILQAHCMAECWGTSPLTAEQVAANVLKKFGIKVTVARVAKRIEYEIKCGRLVVKGKGYVSTGKVANFHSLAVAE